MRETFHWVFYRFVTTTLRIVLSFGARVRVHRFAPWPESAFILASNHISHFDPPIISGWNWRRIDWLAMSELFSTGWSRRAFGWLDTIPVDRTGDDRVALRECLRRLKAGRVVGVFPEGGIRDGDRSLLAGADVKDGALLLAIRAGCPIVPAVLLGSDRLYNRRRWRPWSRANVVFATGEAIYPISGPSRTARDQLREKFSAAIRQLRDRTVEHFRLNEDDLPKSPQTRMRER